jgi:ADP-ribose pyrophosphatase YjhB (NUDIX family)
MKILSPEAHYARLHKIPIAAGAFIRNLNNELLLVKPNYRDGWLIPGGTAEANESPKMTCYREVVEELGLELSLGRLLCVDYRSVSGQESIAFLFDGGVLSEASLKRIRLQEEELSEFAFVRFEQALELCNSFLSARLNYGLRALKQNTTFYLENQVAV